MFRRRKKASSAKVSILKKHTGWLKLTLELFVVFAGVTAGFLLNNWWVNRADKSLENYYYTRFISDLQADLLSLKGDYSYDSTWVSQADSIYIQFIKGDLSEDNVKQAVELLSSYSLSELRSNTFQEITNGGRWHVMKNEVLVKKLHDYYLGVKSNILLRDEITFDLYRREVTPTLFNNIDCLHFEIIEFNKKKAVHIVNMFTFFYNDNKTRMENFEHYIKRIEELIAELEQAID